MANPTTETTSATSTLDTLVSCIKARVDTPQARFDTLVSFIETAMPALTDCLDKNYLAEQLKQMGLHASTEEALHAIENSEEEQEAPESQ